MAPLACFGGPVAPVVSVFVGQNFFCHVEVGRLLKSYYNQLKVHVCKTRSYMIIKVSVIFLTATSTIKNGTILQDVSEVN